MEVPPPTLLDKLLDRDSTRSEPPSDRWYIGEAMIWRNLSDHTEMVSCKKYINSPGQFSEAGAITLEQLEAGIAKVAAKHGIRSE